MVRITVEADVTAERALAYLADPRRRPEWQSSLRAVTDVVPGPDGPAGPGTRWVDVTAVPGVRPRMRTTAAREGQWAEAGDFGPFRAVLTLDVTSTGPSGCRVVADFSVRGAGPLGRVLTLAARPAVAADLRRALRLVGEADPR